MKWQQLTEAATPEQRKRVYTAARSEDVTIYYDKPYNHFKVGFGRWDNFMIKAACILPMGCWEEYNDMWGHPALRVRVK